MSDDNGHVGMTREQVDRLKALPRDQPIHMLNLIRVRELADYPPDHPRHGQGLSGHEAYRAYGRESAPIFERVGGRQVWVGRPDAIAIGPADEHWDIAFIAEYPNFEAFREMSRDPEYQEAVKNRTAATLDSRLIRCAPLTPGKGFGEVAADQCVPCSS